MATIYGARWRIVLATASLLVAGAAIGITVDRVIQSRRNAPASRMAELHRDPLGTIDRELHLRPAQRERIAAILTTHQPAIDAIWSDTHVRLRSLTDSVLTEIAAVLDSGQAQRFWTVAAEVHGPRQRPRHPVPGGGR